MVVIGLTTDKGWKLGRLAMAPNNPQSTSGPGEAMGYAYPDTLDNIRSSNWRAMMARGTVKWFNPTKGYGFIQPASGGKDVFVHISAVERAGLSTLNEGQQVEYEIISDRGKESASNLKVK
jgi:CspA family cold shock protein